MAPVGLRLVFGIHDVRLMMMDPELMAAFESFWTHWRTARGRNRRRRRGGSRPDLRGSSGWSGIGIHREQVCNESTVIQTENQFRKRRTGRQEPGGRVYEYRDQDCLDR